MTQGKWSNPEDYYEQTVNSNSGGFRTKKPKTLVASVRYNIVTLANLVAYSESQGLQAHSVGETLRVAIETMERLVVSAGKSHQFTSQAEALQFLNIRGILEQGTLNTNNSSRLVSSLSLEQLQEEENFNDIHARALAALRATETPVYSGTRPEFAIEPLPASKGPDYSPAALKAALGAMPAGITLAKEPCKEEG
jgi:hypothetical protein